MGDVNQVNLLQHLVPKTDGPVLEIGSKDYVAAGQTGSGQTSSFRNFYTTGEYLGLDVEEGPGVDVVADLCEDISGIPESHFSLIISCSVMEHTPTPWIMAQNMERLVRPGGSIFVSVPWIWRYHAYPDDYYRFSFSAIKYLFPNLEWNQAFYSTNVPGEIYSSDVNPDNRMAVMLDNEEGKPKRKHLPYMMVNALGTRPAG